VALLEIAIDTAEDGRAALSAGADRLEVCSSLDVGGCTPSLGMFRTLRALTGKPLFVMLRPRAGSFVYTAVERSSMVRTLGEFQNEGADGCVFGGLTSEGALDTELLGAILSAAGDTTCTFHRAFDLTANGPQALDVLISHGIERVLTSGGAPTAEEGITQLKVYAEQSRGRIIVLPGGGVRPSNVERILHDTGAGEIHSSGRDEEGKLDPSVVELLSTIAHATFI